ncbi:DUF542 domain-containing protein [Novipirellula maiorica]|nr:DUF542 domain-containing protein [Rhodopirellula maiorica]
MTSIPEWIIEHPETTGVFQELGLDTSCAGKSLQYVCHHHGLSPQAVLARLHQVIGRQ